MNTRLFLFLAFTFIAFTIIGTITHEFGHYAAAKYVGLQPTFHFQSVDSELSENEIELDKILALYQKEIDAKKDFPAKKRFEDLCKIERENDFSQGRLVHYKQCLLVLLHLFFCWRIRINIFLQHR